MGYAGTHKICTQAGGKGRFVARLLVLCQPLAEGTYGNAFAEEMSLEGAGFRQPAVIFRGMSWEEPGSAG